MDEILLGVYGTLKQGNHNYDVHLKPLTPKVANFFDLPVRMYSNGRYPMLVKSDERHSIYLEIYTIDENKLSEIDELELPFGYFRETHSIPQYGNVWLYFFGKPSPPKEFQEIVNGNFIKEIEW